MFIDIQTWRMNLIPVYLCSSQGRSGVWIFRGLFGVHGSGSYCKIVHLQLLGKVGPIFQSLWLAPEPDWCHLLGSSLGNLGKARGHPADSVPLDLTLPVLQTLWVCTIGSVPSLIFSCWPLLQGYLSASSHLCLPAGASRNFWVWSKLHRIRGILGKPFYCYLHCTQYWWGSLQFGLVQILPGSIVKSIQSRLPFSLVSPVHFAAYRSAGTKPIIQLPRSYLWHFQQGLFDL